jgi:hypothetical protein
MPSGDKLIRSPKLIHNEWPEEGSVMVSPASDDRDLRERILRKLALQGIRFSPCLTLDVEGRVVTVRGVVRSYYERQLIVHSIFLVSGHYELHDLIKVVTPASERTNPLADSTGPLGVFCARSASAGREAAPSGRANLDELFLTG